MTREVLHIRGVIEVVCEIHDWTVDRVRAELVPLLRARHGNGGVNVCVECVERWKRWADERRAAREGR